MAGESLDALHLLYLLSDKSRHRCYSALETLLVLMSLKREDTSTAKQRLIVMNTR